MRAKFPKTDLGQLSGSVIDRSGQTIEDGSIAIYKNGGMVNSVDMQGGYIAVTGSDEKAMYSLGVFPSGVYNIRLQIQMRSSQLSKICSLIRL